jgi:hypothetical protein
MWGQIFGYHAACRRPHDTAIELPSIKALAAFGEKTGNPIARN